MQSVAIIGAQWGDEGKGKITDCLSKNCDLVVRYQGGANAGHTIIVGNQKIVLHLIPSGILHAHCVSVVGHGVVFDPEAFKKEMEEVSQFVRISPENLKVSAHCSVITTYNKLLDLQRESKGPVKIGTTGRGIGPCYEDKVGRKVIKLSDLQDKEMLKRKLAENILEKEVLFKHLYQIEIPSIEEEANRLYELGKFIGPYLCDTFNYLDQALAKKKKILYEGAQGILLDIDYGSYPFVTSSSTTIGGIYTGAGVPGQHIDEIVGIAKAYTTRVGQGPFPTELQTSLGEFIQQKGHEFGATTGRKRRCGWIDLPLLKYTAKCSNLTSLALTKLDVLSGLNELKVCHAYRYEGKEIDCAYPGIDLNKVEPIYVDMKPFHDNFEETKGRFSPELLVYIQMVEKSVGIPVSIVAYGPEREQIIFRREFFGTN